MSLQLSLTVPTKTHMKTISVQSCSKATPRCRSETGYKLVCAAWRNSHDVVPHPAWFAGPADTCFCARVCLRTWDVSCVASAPTAVCTDIRTRAALQSTQSMSMYPLLALYAEDHVASGPPQQRAAHGFFSESTQPNLGAYWRTFYM